MAAMKRIPELKRPSLRQISIWFSEMSSRNLLFHPDDDPASIVHVKTGRRMFTRSEVNRLRATLAAMFEKQGDRVYEVAYPIFMRRFRELIGG